MSETNKINPYANIKQHSNADLRLPPRQIVAESDPQTSTLNQNVINFAFKVDINNTAGFQLFVNGVLLREGASNDYVFTNIQADSTSSQVTLTQLLVDGLNIIPQKLGVDKEISPSLANLQSELARRKVYANYISNSTFEYEGTLGYVLYNDGSAVPTDGIGGVVNPNVTFAITQTNPLRGANSALLSKDAANRQGHGVSYDFQIDMADRSKNLMIRFDVEGSANYQAGFAKLYIYDKINLGTPIACVPIDVPSLGQVNAYFASTTSTQYRLILHIASADTSAWSLKVDDIMVGQPDLIFGMPGSDWINSGPLIITSTGSSPTKGTTVTDEMWWRRVGDSMEIRMSYRQSSSGSAGTGDYLFQIPTGYSIDLGKVKASTVTGSNVIVVSDSAVGLFNIGDQTNNEHSTGIASVYDAFNVRMIGDSCTTAQNFPDVMGATHIPLSHSPSISYHIVMTVPIAGWTSNIQLASSKVEYVFNSNNADGNDLTSFGYGAGGVAIGSYTTAERTKRVRFANPVSATDHVFVEVNENGNWVRLADHSLNPSKQNTLRFGIRVTPVASSYTDFDVFFGGGGAEAGAAYGGAGTAWSGYTSLQWRLVKSANALGVESDSVGARYIGSAYIENGSAWTTSSTTPVAFNPNASVSPVVEMNPGPGAISTVASTQPRFTVNNLPAGTYRVIFNAVGSTAASNASLAIWDGTNLSGFVGYDNTQNKEQTLIGYFRYNATGNRTFEAYGQNDGGSPTNIYALGGVSRVGWKLSFSIERVGN